MPSDIRLKFDLLTAEDRKSIAEQAGLIEYLAFHADQANYQCAQLLRQGKKDEAMSVAGAAEAYERLMAMFSAPDPKEPEPEAPFIDPALRFEHETADGVAE